VVVLVLAGVVPLTLLGVLAATRAAALLEADPAGAGDLVRGMLALIAFLLAVGVVTAAGLAVFVSRSVAEPLARLRAAMAGVERGRLDVRAPVLATDEIGRVSEGFNRMVEGLRERELVKEAFGKYVSPEIRDEILGGRIPLDGQLREVTILFADLRDFTPWVERSDPRQVVRDLNAYFTEMEAAIRQHRGLVLQYIGDEIEAVFGAPLADPDHAAHAVRAAVEMRGRLAAWNAARRDAGATRLRHGIGIHSGPVIAGNIGSAERRAYTLVGDAVNLAARLQALTKDAGCDVLVSGDTRRRLDGDVPLTPLPAVRVKGKSEEVEVFRLECEV
jgi:adenylate cyclase